MERILFILIERRYPNFGWAPSSLNSKALSKFYIGSLLLRVKHILHRLPSSLENKAITQILDRLLPLRAIMG